MSMKASLPSDDEFERFVRPWNFDNEFGVPEVDADDIEIGRALGSGNKGSTAKATWEG